MLEAIRQDPSQAELFIEHTEYLRCEIEEAAESEMIVKLEDFLRRRSKISLVVRHQDIVSARGLKDACGVLFGKEAEARYREYVETHGASAHARLKLA
jgi:alpha-glycerophosphate oxidase/glycerol-3-phosphate dehydrogenase